MEERPVFGGRWERGYDLGVQGGGVVPGTDAAKAERSGCVGAEKDKGMSVTGWTWNKNEGPASRWMDGREGVFCACVSGV